MNVIQSGASKGPDVASYDKIMRAVSSMPAQTNLRESLKGAGPAEEHTRVFDLSMLKEEEKKKLDEELEKLNDSISSTGRILKFKYNDEIKESYVEVVDAATQEVVASLPPEFLIDLSLKMKELIGIFIDKKL